MKASKNLQNFLKNIKKDPILILLLKNSNLTNTQLETFLISVLTKNLNNNEFKIDKKEYLRLKGKISRGSFNRTLKQAKKNIISSIYTILLLGYLKVADSSSLLLRYVEASSKLSDYIEFRRKIVQRSDENDLKAIELFKQELEELLSEYALPSKFS